MYPIATALTMQTVMKSGIMSSLFLFGSSMNFTNDLEITPKGASTSESSPCQLCDDSCPVFSFSPGLFISTVKTVHANRVTAQNAAQSDKPNLWLQNVNKGIQMTLPTWRDCSRTIRARLCYFQVRGMMV